MDKPKLNSLVNVEAATALFGEPQYEFIRQHVAYSHGRNRSQGQHYVSCDAIQISEQEYRENIEAANEKELARFYSNPEKRFTQSYWRYEKRVLVPGWPQAIKKMIEEMEKA